MNKPENAKYNGIVTGSLEYSKPIVVGYDTVYFHKNVQPIKDDEGNITSYKYEEWQVSKDEYIAFITEENIRLEEELNRGKENMEEAITDLTLLVMS